MDKEKVEKKFLNFIKKQEVLGEPFLNKLDQLNNFYIPICDLIFKDFIKNALLQSLLVQINSYPFVLASLYNAGNEAPK